MIGSYGIEQDDDHERTDAVARSKDGVCPAELAAGFTADGRRAGMKHDRSPGKATEVELVGGPSIRRHLRILIEERATVLVVDAQSERRAGSATIGCGQGVAQLAGDRHLHGERNFFAWRQNETVS